MKSIPVDTSVLTFVTAETVAKLNDGVQKVSQDGTLQWVIRVMALSARPSVKPEVIDVTISNPTDPAIPLYTKVEFIDLTARFWEMNGRAGISLSAAGVRVGESLAPVPAEPATSAPSKNGQKETATTSA